MPSGYEQVFHIKLNQTNVQFSGPQIAVFGTHFFVYEGSKPYIYKGSILDWTAILRLNRGNKFSQLTPIDSVNMAVRYISPESGQNFLGILNLADTSDIKQNHFLLQKQFDGIFDTDGSFNFNKKLNLLTYIYAYRNQYIIADKSLNLKYRGNTIDTITHAQVKLAKIKNSNLSTFSKPPLIVNKYSYTDRNFLFVNSQLPGKYEPEELWRTASIIDVYDITNKSYRSSFPIYDVAGRKLRSILVNGNLFYALIDEKIVVYKLREYLAQDAPASHKQTRN